jgi:glycosyltransferase involved in cell wall biosynthesis
MKKPLLREWLFLWLSRGEIRCMARKPILNSAMASPTAHVAIILATYNGQAYLNEQLQSLAAQTYGNWHLVASDDGSSDATRNMLEEFAKHHPVTVVAGPQQGFAANFMSGLLHPAAAADYVAFCDQDDIWDNDRLARGVAALSMVSDKMPALYGTCTRLMKTSGEVYGLSPRFSGPFTFRNAMVQCFAGGNTLLMNRAARQLLLDAGNVPIISHDWWAYQLVSGAGGAVIYDPEPSMSYRQHACAIAGSSAGWRANWSRVTRLLTGGWRHWNDLQTAALAANIHLLTPENHVALKHFIAGRHAGLLARLSAFRRSGMYRQTFVSSAGLWVAAVLNRV